MYFLEGLPSIPRCFAKKEVGRVAGFNDVGVSVMWTTPVVTEIAVGLEINCYACADL